MRKIYTLLSLVVAVIAAPASAEFIGNVGDWHIEKEGPICAALVSYDNGVSIVVTEQAGHPEGYVLQMTNSSWGTIQPGRAYTLEVKTDRTVSQVVAIGVNFRGSNGLKVNFAGTTNDLMREVAFSYNGNKLFNNHFDNTAAEAFHQVALCVNGASDPFRK